jgi:pyruvate dehydrogenase E2 component (dihydrolipoamide acetyltransferase)
MAYEVIMPKAGMAMETGKIVKWLKNEGDVIETGEPLLEIETDKVNMEVEAMNSGTLLKILAFEGDEIPVVDTIGYIGQVGETFPDIKGSEIKQAVVQYEEKTQIQTQQIDVLEKSGEKIAATPSAKRIAKAMGIDLSLVKPSGSRGQIKANDVETTNVSAKATPLAKAMASQMGIDIRSISGSGYANKVTKMDVLEKTASVVPIFDEDKIVSHSAMRKVIARRMMQSHTEIPNVTQSCIADVTQLFAVRKEMNVKREDDKISINDIIIMAVAKTLIEQPHINVSYTQDALILRKRVNVGMAVALPEGLIVPVIKDADSLSLGGISTEAKKLVTKAKQGKLSPDEYSGGTFTISNLGMMGVTSFTPIINQPESAILGICAVQQKLEMDDNGNIEKRMKMGLSLTYDHRCIDGAQAAIFSNRIVELLENPILILV